MIRSLLAVGFLLLPSAALRAEELPSPSPPSITVTGHGEATASPDLAVISLAVETESPGAASAAKENARRAARVIDAVKVLLGKGDRVFTTGYSLEPRYAEPRPTRPREVPEIVGYVARNEVKVELHDIRGVGELIDRAIAAGAGRVNNLQFALEQRGPHLSRALAAAAAEARAQAEAIARSLGVRLGPVLAATTGGMPRPLALRSFTAREAAPMAAPTPIEPGEVTVEATLQVTWAVY